MIVMKELKDNQMIERDENGNVVYQGEYLKDDNMSFPRHGHGKEFRNGEMYDGNWVNNHKEGEGKLFVEGHLHYKGMWKNDVANGHGCLYNDEDNIICEGEWKDNVCEMDGKEYHSCNLPTNNKKEKSKRSSVKYRNQKNHHWITRKKRQLPIMNKNHKKLLKKIMKEEMI